MKKVLICLLSMAFVLATGGLALAAVSGPCVNCHTMHNSQGGAAVNAAGPFGALVSNTCLGCHTTPGTDPLGDVNKYPYVMSSTAGAFTDNNCLAGGFLPPLGDGADNLGKAHSLFSTATPPGYPTGYTWYKGTAAPGLTCAGSDGCHGSQTIADDMAAIKGGHHAPTVYRILWAWNAGAPAGVVGTGATDYEEALILNTTPTVFGTTYTAAGKHNVYKAVKDGTDTISQFCANCHGNFHSDDKTLSDNVWKRHPTDVLIPSDWTIQTGGYTLNDRDLKYNPPGYNGAEGGAGTRYATCLSCHRAHGTGNNDLLRFGYLTGDALTVEQVAGSGKAYGCLGCHNKQR